MANKVDIKALNTKRLLAYYKSQRTKVKTFEANCKSDKDFEELFLGEQYLKEIKKELDTRENV